MHKIVLLVNVHHQLLIIFPSNCNAIESEKPHSILPSPNAEARGTEHTVHLQGNDRENVRSRPTPDCPRGLISNLGAAYTPCIDGRHSPMGVSNVRAKFQKFRIQQYLKLYKYRCAITTPPFNFSLMIALCVAVILRILRCYCS